jgi:hypothetical protein
LATVGLNWAGWRMSGALLLMKAKVSLFSNRSCDRNFQLGINPGLAEIFCSNPIHQFIFHNRAARATAPLRERRKIDNHIERDTDISTFRVLNELYARDKPTL